jgi:hypothetical protein
LQNLIGSQRYEPDRDHEQASLFRVRPRRPPLRTFLQIWRNELARIWNIDADRIPTSRGLVYPDIIEAAVAGKIRAL